MKTAYLVAGLAFGDEGKGAVVDILSRNCQSSLIVRYNGGPQAAHNVVTPDGRHHTFSQFGSGMFTEGVRTHLSRFMFINPLNMMCEEEHLQEVGIKDAWKRLTVDENCVVITPYQRSVNRIEETALGDNRHGSCGQGLGVARQDQLWAPDEVLYASDLLSEETTKEKLEYLRKINLTKVKHSDELLSDPASVNWIWEQYKHWPALLVSKNSLELQVAASDVTIFEGAQGMMLDEKWGTAPHNTWTDITFNNAEMLLNESKFGGKVVKIGVVRTYYTRHGAGPFPTETPDTIIHPELHNGTNEYQGAFRQGTFDENLLKYALEKIGGVDFIALNHLDARGSGDAMKKISDIGVPMGILGWGPTAKSREIISDVLP